MAASPVASMYSSSEELFIGLVGTVLRLETLQTVRLGLACSFHRGCFPRSPLNTTQLPRGFRFYGRPNEAPAGEGVWRSVSRSFLNTVRISPSPRTNEGAVLRSKSRPELRRHHRARRYRLGQKPMPHISDESVPEIPYPHR
jgi:hypothetical protein